jgi:cysteinyl-tRNA synthetase
MALSIYNTLARKVVDFDPLEAGKISMYVCGPTVYDYFHIGNARSFVIADIIRRYFEYRNYDVKFVMNITDIDDKIIKRANEEGIPASDLANKYADAFIEDLGKLGVRPADILPRATDTIDAMIEHIAGLIEKGLAYDVDGDVFYSVDSFKGYGKLSGKKLEDLQVGARVEADTRKRNPVDFALWKSVKPGEPAWDSPWGRGRPGWHIECSVMSQMHLGETFDIHAGGNDLIFPHHENEIAQSEGLTDKPFARYWMHFGFLNIDNEKMSKSIGNFFTARDIVKEYPAEVIRFFYLQTHYRGPLNFTKEGLDAAEKGLRRLQDAYNAFAEIPEGTSGLDLTPYSTKFEAAVDDDLNFPAGLGVLFELVKAMNTAVGSGNGLHPENKQQVIAFMDAVAGGVFGLLSSTQVEETGEGDFGKLMQILIEVRAEARVQKQYGLSDIIRDKLKEIEIVIEDGKDGSTWKRERQR